MRDILKKKRKTLKDIDVKLDWQKDRERYRSIYER